MGVQKLDIGGNWKDEMVVRERVRVSGRDEESTLAICHSTVTVAKNNVCFEGREVALEVLMLAPKPDNLSSIPWNSHGGGEKRTEFLQAAPPPHSPQGCPGIHVCTHNRCKKVLFN